MAASDIAGLLASFALAVPAARDQLLRLKNFNAREKQTQDRTFGAQWKVIAEVWAERRNYFYPSDTALTLLGSVGLIAAFGLKLLDA